jgi:hypothetical protein
MDFELNRYEEIDVYNVLDILRRSTLAFYPSVRISEIQDEEKMKFYLEKEALSALTTFAIRDAKMYFKELPPLAPYHSLGVPPRDPYFERVRFESRLTVVSQPDVENIVNIINKIARTVGPRIRLAK